MDPRLRGVLEEANPWWKDPAQLIHRVKPLRRDAFERVAARCLGAGGPKLRATIVVGLRQVGKTELARQLAQDALTLLGGTQVAMVEVDDIRFTGALTLADVLEAWKPYRQANKPALLIVDEIQKLSDPGGKRGWARQLKGLIDKQEIRVMATGSAAAVLAAGDAEGAGRTDIVHIEPLSFGEFRRLRAGFGGEVAHATRQIDLDFYLTFGGFPEFARETDVPNCLERIRRYAGTVLRADLDRFKKPEAIGQLFAVLVDQSGEVLNVESLASKLQIAQNTVKDWIHAMEEVFLIERVPRLDTSVLRETAKRPKIYATDPGIVAAMGPSLDPLGNPRLRGRLLEAAVLRHLRELARKCRGKVRCLQKQKTGQAEGEADFVLLAGDGAYVLEVKSTRSPGPKKGSRALAMARELSSGDKMGEIRALVLHAGTAREDHELPWIPLAHFLEDIFQGPAEDLCASLNAMSKVVGP